MTVFGSEPLPVEDVVNEIFDMANPADPEKITLNGTLLNLLINSRSFKEWSCWNYYKHHD
jgi:hypothetical protein